MAGTGRGKKRGEEQPRRPLGMRFTERFLLPFTGPAEIGDARRVTATTDEQRERGAQLQRQLRIAPGPDGRAYYVDVDPMQERAHPATAATEDGDAPGEQVPRPGA